MKKLNQAVKVVALSLVVALLVSVAPIKSFAASEPKQPDGRGRIALEYIGAKVCRTSQSVVAKSCVVGSGMLYELCAFGTAAVVGKGMMAFDSAVTSSMSNFQATFNISPIVYGTSAVGSVGPDQWTVRCWKPSVPVRYENGLGLLADDGSISGLATYRPDSGPNP